MFSLFGSTQLLIDIIVNILIHFSRISPPMGEKCDIVEIHSWILYIFIRTTWPFYQEICHVHPLVKVQKRGIPHSKGVSDYMLNMIFFLNESADIMLPLPKKLLHSPLVWIIFQVLLNWTSLVVYKHLEADILFTKICFPSAKLVCNFLIMRSVI